MTMFSKLVCAFIQILLITSAFGEDMAPNQVNESAIRYEGQLVGTVLNLTGQFTPDNFARLESAKTMDVFIQILGDMSRPLPATDVVVTAISSSAVYKATTDSNGAFSLVGLSDQPYEISAAELAWFFNTGEKRMATDKVQYQKDKKGRLNLWIRSGWVTVKGRVLDTDGQPITGAEVRGCPDADYSEQARKYPTRYAVSGSDGSYELVDLAPPDISDIAAYLRGRDPAHFSMTPFYLYVNADAEGFQKGAKYAAHIPLITEELIKPARRIEKVMTALESVRDGHATPNMQELPLPASQSNTITGIDIVLEKIEVEK